MNKNPVVLDFNGRLVEVIGLFSKEDAPDYDKLGLEDKIEEELDELPLIFDINDVSNYNPVEEEGFITLRLKCGDNLRIKGNFKEFNEFMKQNLKTL